MSRCLPFSPEAYAKRRLNREALIKPQKEKDETNAGNSKEKGIKIKFKKQRKHEEEKTLEIGTDHKSIKLSDEKKNDNQNKNKPYLNAGSPPESAGRSDITEEHDLPSCSGSVCNFHDSGDSRNKRKRQDNPVRTTSERRIIRIRLPLRKHSEPDDLAIEQPKNCQPEAPETLVEERTKKHASHSKTESKSVENGQLKLKQTLELPLAASERAETEISKASLLYKTLIEDWVPDHPGVHLLQTESDDDEDWLLGSRLQQQRQEPKRHKTGHEVPCSSTTWWPQAIYLSEVDIFALPYTLPY